MLPDFLHGVTVSPYAETSEETDHSYVLAEGEDNQSLQAAMKTAQSKLTIDFY
jgi:hypothetical protein